MLQRVPSTWDAVSAPRHSLRLLIEDDDPVLAISDFDCYHDAGMMVALCSGPGPDAGTCPVLSGGPCHLLSAADVVLNHLGPRSGVANAIRHGGDGPELVTVGGAGADLSEVATVGSRIRAVQRRGRRTTRARRSWHGPSDPA